MGSPPISNPSLEIWKCLGLVFLWWRIGYGRMVMSVFNFKSQAASVWWVKYQSKFQNHSPSILDWFLRTEKMRELLLDVLFMKYFTIIDMNPWFFQIELVSISLNTINTKICMPNFKVHNLFYHHTKADFGYLWLMIWNEWYEFRYIFFIFKFLSFTLPT